MSTSRNVASLEQRIQKAAKAMKITEDELWAILGEMGIDKGDEDALEMIEAETTTEASAETIFAGHWKATCQKCEWSGSCFKLILLNRVFPNSHGEINTSQIPIPELRCPGCQELVRKPLQLPGMIPSVRFKAGWAILKGRQNAEKDNTHAVAVASSFVRPIAQYKDEELIGAYGEECSSDILDELNRRSSGRPFVVFDEDGKVDAEMSLRMLRIARRQPTSPQHVVMKDGKSISLRLHPVGAFPTFWVEECPIHPDVILVDGYCEECDETFDGISEGDRKAIRIYADVVGSAVMDRQFVHDMLKRVRKDGSGYLLELPAAFRRFNELEEIERLPVLRRRPSTMGGKKDPFYMHNRI